MSAPGAHSGDFPRPFATYTLLGPLGHGGMGEVFLATTRGMQGAVRLVVIKTIRPDVAGEKGYVNRFLDEARVAVQIQHANICQVFDVGECDDVHYLAMEHITGTNLRRLLDALAVQGRMMPPGVALHLLAETLDALDFVHRQQHALTGEPLHIVHRDVSPQNIMLSFEGEVKLIDFGLAVSALKVEETESHVVLGKIAYMSPEQARGDPVDATSDQFSAAIVLYELLTGERYYGRRAPREIWAVAGAGYYAPTEMRAIAPECRAILERALKSDRTLRFSSCGAFAAAVRDVLQRQHPDCDRAKLRGFIADVLKDDLSESHRVVRTLTKRLMQGDTSRSEPTVEGVVPVPAAALPREPHSAADSNPTGSLLEPPSWAQPRVFLAASALGCALLLSSFAMFTLGQHEEPALPRAAMVPQPLAPLVDVERPIVSAPVVDPTPAAPALEVPAPPTPQVPPQTSPPTQAVPQEPPQEPPQVEPPQEAPKRAHHTRHARRAAVVAPPDAPDAGVAPEVAVPDSTMDLLAQCSAPCARHILRIRSEGTTPLLPAAVNACKAKCSPD